MNLKDKLNTTTQEELRLLGHGIMTDLEQNTAALTINSELRQLASFLTCEELFPLTQEQNQAGAFLLSGDQIYVRARLLNGLIKAVQNEFIITKRGVNNGPTK